MWKIKNPEKRYPDLLCSLLLNRSLVLNKKILPHKSSILYNIISFERTNLFFGFKGFHLPFQGIYLFFQNFNVFLLVF